MLSIPFARSRETNNFQSITCSYFGNVSFIIHIPSVLDMSMSLGNYKQIQHSDKANPYTDALLNWACFNGVMTNYTCLHWKKHVSIERTCLLSWLGLSQWYNICWKHITVSIWAGKCGLWMIIMSFNPWAWRQKGLTGYCFKYTDRTFCLWTDELCVKHMSNYIGAFV